LSQDQVLSCIPPYADEQSSSRSTTHGEFIAPSELILWEEFFDEVASFPFGQRQKYSQRWIKKKYKNDRIWREKHHEAFQELKSVFQKTIEEGGIRLAHPLPGREYIIRTDASDAGISAALLQRTPEGDELPIMYARTKIPGLSGRMLKCYAVPPVARNITFEELLRRVRRDAAPYTYKEALAVKKWFSHYVWGTIFKVYTDHAPLLSAFKNRQLDNIRLGLWIEELTGFDFELIHVPGKNNELADILPAVQIK
ncbi:2724_t:CDS:2, partial [Paraglomus occultum]